MINDAPVSMVDTSGFPNPAVKTVEVTRDALAAFFRATAVPPPAIMAYAHVITGFKLATVDTITIVRYY